MHPGLLAPFIDALLSLFLDYLPFSPYYAKYVNAIPAFSNLNMIISLQRKKGEL